MRKITSKKEILETVTFEEVYQYYIVENHSKPDCYEHFNTTERIFRAFLEYYSLKKPRQLVKCLADSTKELHYGDTNYNNKEKREQTCLERYNSTSPLACEEIWQKTYDSTIKNHGATGFAAKSKQERVAIAKKANAAMWDKYHNDETFAQNYQQSQNETKAKNNSFNTSKKEKALYKQLCDKFGIENVIEQYRDERYPFNCDFYIKSEDLFIELNAHWTHGPHPFDDKNTEDICLLQKWQEKAKTSKFYVNAINTWTVRDTAKLKYFVDNKLNFIILYNNLEIKTNDYKY